MPVRPTPPASSFPGSEPEKAQEEHLLKSALENQESARKAFLRDMKLALLIIAAFQLLFLPQFVQLSDEMQSQTKELETLRPQEDATHELQADLESLQSVLKHGNSRLTKEIKAMPVRLRRQFTLLNAEIKALHKRDMRGAPTPPEGQATQALQNAQAAFGFLSALSAEEKKGILSTDPKVFRTAISPIVRAEIIKPEFARLNLQLSLLLQRPYAAAAKRVKSVLNKRSAELAKAGVDSDRIREQLDAGDAKLSEMRFIPPDSDSWWTSFASKGATAAELGTATNKVTTDVNQQLSLISKRNAAAEAHLVALVHDTEEKQRRIHDSIQELEGTLQTIQGTLADKAKPFTLIAVQPRDAVLYFPVGIALVYAYLTFEFIFLGGRVRRLRNAYRELGYSTETLRLYFAGVPGTTVASASMITLLFLAPLAMCFWSVHRIDSSNALAAAGLPSALYVLAEILISVCFLVALFGATTLALRFRRERS